MDLDAPSNPAVIAALRWLGTPYHHQASTCGAGCDCLGLIRGVFREVCGRECESPPPFSRDWGETNDTEPLLAAAHRHLLGIHPDDLAAGDILIFRLRAGTIAKHAAILASSGTMIHAMEGTCVSEVPFSNWWRRRLAAAFRFPL